MTDNEKELRRIMNAYIELSAWNMERALDEYIRKCDEISETYKNKLNDNSNKT